MANLTNELLCWSAATSSF